MTRTAATSLALIALLVCLMASRVVTSDEADDASIDKQILSEPNVLAVGSLVDVLSAVSVSPQNESSQQVTAANDANADSASVIEGSISTEPVLFEDKMHKCHLYAPLCTFQVLVSKSVIATPGQKLSVISADTFVFDSCTIIKHEALNDSYIDANSSGNTSSISVSDSLKKQCGTKCNERDLYTVTYMTRITGAALMVFQVVDSETDSAVLHANLTSYTIVITQPRRIIDFVFNVWVWSFSLVIATLMGVLIDKEVLLQIIKIPYPIAIGFCCQYMLMPLFTFGFCHVVELRPIEALTLFIYGCSPGGTSSNNWAILFNGDIDLSAILTFVSTASSLFVLPAWLYTLGTVFSEKADIHLPFLKLIFNVMITVIPVFVGMLLSNFFPKIKTFVRKIAKPFTLTMMIAFIGMILASKSYSFPLIQPNHWLAVIIPWFGYIIGGTCAWIARLPVAQIKTVALETGIQNVGVAFLIILTNFESPDADYAFLPMLAVSFMTNIPLYLILVFLKLFRFIKTKLNGGKRGPNTGQRDVANQSNEKEIVPLNITNDDI